MLDYIERGVPQEHVENVYLYLKNKVRNRRPTNQPTD